MALYYLTARDFQVEPFGAPWNSLELWSPLKPPAAPWSLLELLGALWNPLEPLQTLEPFGDSWGALGANIQLHRVSFLVSRCAPV